MEAIEKLTACFTDLMIQKIESLSGKWQTPWIKLQGQRPKNIRGTFYNAGNSFLLSLLCEMRNYKHPIFLTFIQAKEKGVKILKGERSHPIYYYNCYFLHEKTKQKITAEEYKNLSAEKKIEYKKFMFLKYYNVFNIEQTDFIEVHPEEYLNIENEAKDKFNLPVTNNFVGISV